MLFVLEALATVLTWKLLACGYKYQMEKMSSLDVLLFHSSSPNTSGGSQVMDGLDGTLHPRTLASVKLPLLSFCFHVCVHSVAA